MFSASPVLWFSCLHPAYWRTIIDQQTRFQNASSQKPDLHWDVEGIAIHVDCNVRTSRPQPLNVDGPGALNRIKPHLTAFNRSAFTSIVQETSWERQWESPRLSTHTGVRLRTGSPVHRGIPEASRRCQSKLADIQRRYETAQIAYCLSRK